jgi:23S rRNA (cytosine1962-C5)-methyltransferase
VRVLTINPKQQIDQLFFEEKVQLALSLRQFLDPSQTDAYRLINAEGDFLPGAIVDYYAGILVVQLHTAGIDRLQKELLAALIKVVKPTGILMRNDMSVRVREGLKREEARIVYGEVPEEVIVRENNFKFKINLRHGQKTGFFTDQRDKRQALQKYVQPGRFLNCFSYTGSFSIYAAVANAKMQVISIDQSEPAIKLAQDNFVLNNLNPDDERYNFLIGDVFEYLQEMREQKQQFELLVLDPPAFAKSHTEKENALRGYVKLNEAGLLLVKPGGILVTCSCSGSVSLEEFGFCLTQAATHVRRQVQVLETYENGLDHPVTLSAPESRYLKVLFCRVI